MDSNSNSSGFDNHVMGQLQDIAQRHERRGRGDRGARRESRRGFHPSRFQNSDPPQQFDWSSRPEDFPPLGTIPSGPPSSNVSTPSLGPHADYQHLPGFQHGASGRPPRRPLYDAADHQQPFNSTYQVSPREFQERARGSYRGRNLRFSSHHSPASFPAPASTHHTNSYDRTSHRPGQLYNPTAEMSHGSFRHQRTSRHLIFKQSEYLQKIGQDAHQIHRLPKDESLKKEAFRQELELVAKETIAANYAGLDLGQVRLKCYGSLANGFGLTGCDMDLLLALPDHEELDAIDSLPPPSDLAPGQDNDDDQDLEEHGFKVQFRRVLEKALLDRGYGARLLTKTRVPILRVCQLPGDELLTNLRENRAAWERSSYGVPTDAEGKANETVETPTATVNTDVEADVAAVAHTLADLNLAAPANATTRNQHNAKLEFTGDVGIHCDINFTNFVAVHNSTLLRIYHNYDTRVADLGIFVKIWAKARDINTPYRGTLSSYGYILMVLHFLMNIAKPPVIPNLQALAKIDDSWYPDKPIELFEGFDIRFIQNPTEIEQIRASMPQNTESTGQLLRGFFQYYATREGFHWTRDVISIREKTGHLSKVQKGWTEAKWSQKSKQQVRLRYLLAIEDPFEVDHNIARTVGHHGLVAIRDEFRRAWSIIEKVGTDADLDAEDFFEPAANRGDTLRKDQEFHRQKQLQMRQEVEAREKETMQKAIHENPDASVDGTSGIPDHGASQPTGDHVRPSNSKLTRNSHQEVDRKKEPWRQRKIKVDSDSEIDGDDDSKGSLRTRTESSHAESDPALNDNNGRCGVFFSPGEVAVSYGFDEEGNVIPWDMTTQDGRWLQWRDNKVRSGATLIFENPFLRELDQQCPFDPRRPKAPSGTYSQWRSARIDQMAQRPPWPASEPTGKTSTDDAVQGPIAHVAVAEGGVTAPETSMEPISHERTPESNRVGATIPWDATTDGGSWLSWRDDLIRRDLWKNRVQYFRRDLHNNFPYKPDMTWSELDEKNEELRRNHMHRPSRARPAEHAPRPDQQHGKNTTMIEDSRTQALADGVASSNAANTAPEILAEEVSASFDHIPLSAQGRRLSLDIGPQPFNPFAWERQNGSRTPDSEFVRAQRLSFFRSQETPANDDHLRNVQFFSNTNSAPSDDTGIMGAEAYEIAELGTTVLPSPPPFSRSRTRTQQLESDDSYPTSDSIEGDDKITSSLNGSTEPAGDHVMTVPATLYPGVPRESRPRDEDPNIMPIPEEVGYQFDSRQLQDLSIIASGGNGCARNGAAFSIEEDYEWGGGGRMGYGPSSGVQEVELNGLDDTPYEAGHGDQEGLLVELPGSLD